MMPTTILSNSRLRSARARRGSTIVLMCLLLPVVLAIAAFVINVVYMELARTELQISTDVATRAAGRVLAVTGDQQQAIDAADRLLKANPFANETLPLSGADIVFGVSTRIADTERYQFSPGSNPNAVRVSANGSVKVPTLFPTMGVPIDFRPIKSSISTQTVVDIALVMDRSGSMAFSSNEVSGAYMPSNAPPGWIFGMPVPPKSRWLDAVDAVERFIKLMEESHIEEHLSLSTYSSDMLVNVGLSENYNDIRNGMDFYTDTFIGGTTNIGGGILSGWASLSDKKTARPWASRVMIVLTDGIHNFGVDPILAAQQAAAQNVIIYTITFSSEADQARMQEIAKIGAGRHYHAATPAQLVEAFEQIAKSLPTLITF